MLLYFACKNAISSKQLKLDLLWYHNLFRNKGKQIITIYYSWNHLENSANISKWVGITSLSKYLWLIFKVGSVHWGGYSNNIMMGHLFLIFDGLFLISHLKIKRIQNITVKHSYSTEFVRSLMKPNTKNEHNDYIMAR